MIFRSRRGSTIYDDAAGVLEERLKVKAFMLYSGKNVRSAVQVTSYSSYIFIFFRGGPAFKANTRLG